jgi:preprotein translocase subunit SecG
MNIAYYFVIFFHIVACLFLIGVVLLQQGKSQDLASAFGGGGTQTAFGPRGSANVLSRATTILAGIFMVTSLALSILRPGSSSVLERMPAAEASPGPAAASPASPAAGASSPAGGAASPDAGAATPDAATATPPPPSPTPEAR